MRMRANGSVLRRESIGKQGEEGTSGLSRSEPQADARTAARDQRVI